MLDLDHKGTPVHPKSTAPQPSVEEALCPSSWCLPLGMVTLGSCVAALAHLILLPNQLQVILAVCVQLYASVTVRYT